MMLLSTAITTRYRKVGVLPNRLLEAMERGATERVAAQVTAPLKVK